MKLLKKLFRKYNFVLFLPALSLAGCGVWENFTTYFNLYYNTSDTFEEAEKIIYTQERDLFSTEELKIPSTADQLLTKVVEKASKILQFHNQSAFVDDALLMLGKSLYYQKNYQKALRKFQELLSTEPNSSLGLETQLWIGKTEMRLKNYTEAIDILHAVRDTAAAEGEDEILKNAFVEEIVYYITVENYSSAITVTNDFLKAADDDVVKAEIYYELGKLYSQSDDIQNAIASFRQVANYSPSYFTEVRSGIEVAKALRQNNQAQEALSILEDMGDQQKYFDDYPEIDLETGITLIDLKRQDEALEMLTYVDTSYTTTPFSGIAKYKKGELFEYYYKNFDSASVFYSRSAGTNMPPEYIIQANEKSALFKKYWQMRNTLDEQLKNLFYVMNPDSFVQDSIAYFTDSAETAEQNTLLADQEINQPPVANNNEVVDEPLQNSNDRTIPAANPTTLNRPNPTLHGYMPEQNTETSKKAPIRPLMTADSINTMIVKSEFDLANIFFTEFDLPDSAYKYYYDIVNNHPGSLLYKNSIFGLASYYETINDTVKADSIYNFIYDNFKTDPIVNAAAKKINKPVIDLEYDPAKDLYAQAEKLMLDKNYSESIQKFINIYENYPDSKLAPKALYAGGWILENELKLYDSAAVVYDSVASRYPESVYARNVKPKIDEYNNELAQKKAQAELAEQQRLLKEQEQLQQMQQPGDSLNTGTAIPDSLQPEKLPEPVQNPINNPDNEMQSTRQPPADTSSSQKAKDIEQQLRQMHQVQVDSLERSPVTPVDTLMNLNEKIDSLNNSSGKNIK